jgi:hypothetical protein
MTEKKRIEQWLLEANDKSLLKPTLEKDKFLPDYINTANLIFNYIAEKAETGIFLQDLTVSTTLHHNTVAVYCIILAKLNLIRPQKVGRETLYLYKE